MARHTEILAIFRIRSVQIVVSVLLIIGIVWMVRPCPKSTLIIRNDCQLSMKESDGFICESNDIWNERKNTYHGQDQKNLIRRKTGFFFYDNWSENFQCSNARRVGSMGEGGKWVCDLFQLKARPDCLVYSAGSNGEFSFEIELKKVMPHCEIHTFDKDYHPYPKDVCIFHTMKLGNSIQEAVIKNWTTLLQELNHTNRIVDILKMDIEGDEYIFFPSIFDSTNRILPKQILIELHPQQDNITHPFFEQLRNHSYVIFAKEENILAGPWFYEYAFLRLNPRFFLSTSATLGQ